MSLRNVAGLYLVRMRGRIGQELLALVGIAVGVALLFAALVANSSLTGSFERVTRGIVGDAQFQVTARGEQTMGQSLLGRAQSLPGVAKAAGLIEARAEIVGPDGRESVRLLGVTPELAELGGPFSTGVSYSALANVRAVALSTRTAQSLGLALAQPVTLVIGGRRVHARLGAKLQASDVGPAIDSPFVLAPLRYAQQLLAKPGQITRVLVLARRGEEASVGRSLRRLAGTRADVRPADFDAELLRQAATPTSQSTTMFSVFGALVGFLFAFSAMLLTVPHRRHLIADLQTEGYRPRVVLKVLAFDAVVLGAVASALGIVLGDQVARHLFDETPSFLQYAFPVGGGRIVEVQDVAIAAVGGLAASCIAVLGPTLSSVVELPRRVLRVDRRGPVAAVDTLSLGGISLLAAGGAVVIAAPTSSTLGIGGLVCLTIAMLLLLPAFLRLAVSLFDRLTENLAGVVPFLVSFDLRDPTARARCLAVAATGAVAVFGSVALQGAHADLLRGLDQTSRDVVAMGDVWAIAPGRANLLVTSSFPAPTVGRVAGIARVDAYRGGFLDIGDRRLLVFGPPASGPMPLSPTQVIEGSAAEASARLRTGGWIVLSAGVARKLGLHVGDRFTLPSPVPLSTRIAALSTNLGWPPGAIVMNADDYRRAWGSADVSALLARLVPGASPAAGRRALRAALGRDSFLSVQTASEHEEDQRRSSRSALARLAQIATLVLVAAVIAMAAAMGGLIWQRRTFLAGVKIEGYRTTAMWRALLLEAAILIGVGCVAGAAFGLLGQVLLSRALTSVTGFPVVYSPAAVGAALTCAAVTLSAVAIVSIFGQRAASVSPESGIGG